MRNYYLRNAVTLGTGLTALFLLVHCTVEERDYTPLGIGQTAGSGGGGSGGSGGDGTGGTSAGTGGLGGLGGQGGAPVEPIPCNAVIADAGLQDAGFSDAGLSDAGLNAGGPNDAGLDAACECVDGFIRAVDADGDGDGTRECSVAPGLDCDDGDGAVTHNTCGGCTALPNAIGDDCLDCGSYVCGGPDVLVCASKPDAVVVDPDCQCQDGAITARDTDGDGAGTRLCEANPGSDCYDGNNGFITDACGGCDESPLGTLGADCNACGVWACNGTAMVCAPKTGAGGQRCSDANTRETCGGSGLWSNTEPCVHGCYSGSCAPCTLGSLQCYDTDTYQQCVMSINGGIGWSASVECSPGTCNPATGNCTGYLLLPRDRNFDVVPLLERGLPWHDVLNTASDSDYG